MVGNGKGDSGKKPTLATAKKATGAVAVGKSADKSGEAPVSAPDTMSKARQTRPSATEKAAPAVRKAEAEAETKVAATSAKTATQKSVEPAARTPKVADTKPTAPAPKTAGKPMTPALAAVQAEKAKAPAPEKSAPPAKATVPEKAPAPAAKPAQSSKPAPAPIPLPPLANDGEIAAIVEAAHGDPFAFLGMHSLGDGHPMVVRAFVPSAVSVSVVDVKSGKSVASLDRMHDAGFFAGAILDRDEWFPYRLRIEAEDGTSTDAEDAYRFPSLLSEKQATALVEGNLLDSYEVLGAHPTTIDGVKGVAFAVWAPKAARVAVIGDFNDWDGRCHGMRLRHECGVWEIFVPGVEAGHFYKYEIKAAPGVHPFEKSDPYAFQAERWPGSASTVCDLTTYRWRDRKWMAGRKEFASREAPLAIYEVHLGSWKRVPEEGNRWMTYRELAEDLPAYVKDLGFTHIEFMPISEFSFEGSWGYQPVALYAPTGRFGSPEDFCYLVDRCHQVGIGVIIGWAPTHFADEPYGLGNFDGGSLYEHPDPKQQRHPRWHTLMYDYGRPEVANFLISNSLFWLDKYHVDGLRVHGLASILYLDYDRGPGEWSRNRFGGHENLEAVDFVRRMNEAVYEKHPGAFTMAEESSGWPMVSRPTFLGGLGFGFKWNEAWLHETLRYMSRNPVHRKYYHEELTHGPTFAFQENHVIPLAHTEVVHGKGPLLARMPGNPWDKFAHLRSYYALVYTHPGKKLMFMGNEFAQGREWNHEMSLDWHLLDEWMHGGIRTLVRDLNQLYVATPALYEQDCEEDGFEWIDANDTEQSVISYLRVGRDRTGIVAVVSNFTPVVRHGYRIGVPEDGYWKEQVNTDAERYGGSNVGNAGGVEAIHEGMHGRPYALSLTLPPYSTVVLQHVGERPSEGDAEA